MTRILGVWVLAACVCGTLRSARGFDDGFAGSAAMNGAGEARLEPLGTASLGRPGSVYRGIQPAAYAAPATMYASHGEVAPPQPAPWYPEFQSGPACGKPACGGTGCGTPDGCEPECKKPHKPCWFPRRPCYINPQYEPEWYVGGSFGFHEPDDWTIQTTAATMLIDPNGGWQGAATLGWSSGLTYMGRRRMEIELAVRDSDLDQFTLGNLNFLFDGQATVYSGMVNVLWDFKHKDRDWYPYAGLGLGAAEITFEHDLPNFTSDEFHDNVFAWQLIGGVTWRARAWMELFADLRYFSTTTPEFDVSINQPIATPVTGVLLPAGRQSLRSEYHTFGAMFGARILLGKRYCREVPTCDGRPTSGGGWQFRRD